MSFVSTLISFFGGAVAFFPDDVHELIGKGNVEIIRMIAEAGGQIPLRIGINKKNLFPL